MDEHGYPTKEELEKIKNWDYRDFGRLMEYVESLWKYGGNFWEEFGNTYSISTGGWSGNEDIIEALGSNTIFWLLHWQQSSRGGHYIFKK